MNQVIENLENSEVLKNLFKIPGKLVVPSYQRAYAWKDEQLKQFVSDMLEMKGKGEYYYGHFILEETTEGFEIIDGQQRITTFVLFLMVCRLLKSNCDEDYIEKFETVDYDKIAFDIIKKELKDIDKEWKKEDFKFQGELTLSIERILFALNYFRKLFSLEKSELSLNLSEIDEYVKVLAEAHISKHITSSKALAVQIFELQNTRGIKLNLIEKVKSKLMKAIYINADLEKKNNLIAIIQRNFAQIYQLEESACSNAFRGELTLEDILLHHLRMVDDGSKLSENDKNLFNSPSKNIDKEKSILGYLDTQISEKKPLIAVEYIVSLAQKFKESVELVSKELPSYDINNHLIGDVLILDKTLSLEFFILLHHKRLKASFELITSIRSWEKLLFTRDFHDKYHGKQYRDDFQEMFREISHISNEKDLDEILSKFLSTGFRQNLMEKGSLSETVKAYINSNRKNILNNAFHWWQEKMVYLLYKYELEDSKNLEDMRKIMKRGRSIEHILPQEWSQNWIEDYEKKDNQTRQELSNEINSFINGIGNLLLITAGENSSLSNNHPKEKRYKSCARGYYETHNLQSDKWEDHTEWENIITDRGNKIFNFLLDFSI